MTFPSFRGWTKPALKPEGTQLRRSSPGDRGTDREGRGLAAQGQCMRVATTASGSLSETFSALQ